MQLPYIVTRQTWRRPKRTTSKPLALAEALSLRPLQAHCHHGLGTLYTTTGRRQQAHAALSAAIALYRTMDMTFWLPQAEAARRGNANGIVPQRC